MAVMTVESFMKPQNVAKRTVTGCVCCKPLSRPALSNQTTTLPRFTCKTLDNFLQLFTLHTEYFCNWNLIYSYVLIGGFESLWISIGGDLTDSTRLIWNKNNIVAPTADESARGWYSYKPGSNPTMIPRTYITRSGHCHILKLNYLLVSRLSGGEDLGVFT